MSGQARGFLVTRYLLGVRGSDLEEGLEQDWLRPGRALALALGHTDRRQRAEALKAPLSELMVALDRRTFARGRS